MGTLTITNGDPLTWEDNRSHSPRGPVTVAVCERPGKALAAALGKRRRTR